MSAQNRKALDVLTKGLEKLRDEVVRVAQRKSVQGVAEEILTQILATTPTQGVPRDEGDLASTGAVTMDATRPAAVISFGGVAAPYALRQHEDLTLNHTVGEAKYISRAVLRYRFTGGASAAEAVRENMREAARRAKQ